MQGLIQKAREELKESIGKRIPNSEEFPEIDLGSICNDIADIIDQTFDKLERHLFSACNCKKAVPKKIDGARLLHIFRRMQEVRGNQGCYCNDCEMDMKKALALIGNKEGDDGV